MNILDKSYKSNIEELKNKVITGQTASISWRIQQIRKVSQLLDENKNCLLYTSPSPRDGQISRMPSSA